MITENPNSAVQEAESGLLEGLFNLYRLDREVYRRNPTPRNWRSLAQSFACWRVAFTATEGHPPPPIAANDGRPAA